MTVAAFTQSAAALTRRFADGRLVWWALAALALIVARALATGGAELANNLGDADDAARLLQVRELLAGAPWFDTTTYKMGGDAGVLSHWSRLIDLPLAVIVSALRPLLGESGAELATRAIWPAIVLFFMLWVLAESVSRAAGRTAAAIALCLAVLGLGALYQFALGRIDHHNVMIAATVGAALLIWSRWGEVESWAAAGALGGLALAVGYESLAPVVVILGLPVALALWEPRLERPVTALVGAFAAVFAAAFVITIPPSRWLVAHCDAISLNMAALAVFGAAGVAVALRTIPRTALGLRLAVMSAFAAAGLTIYGALDPRCLAGPLAQLPASLWPIWMDKVAENESIVMDVVQGRMDQSLALLAFFALGLAAQIGNWRRSESTADFYLLVMVAGLAALGCWQYKYVSYGSWIAIAPLAVWMSRLEGSADVSTTTTRLSAIALANQSTLILITSCISTAFALSDVQVENIVKTSKECLKVDAVSDLDAIPAGLMIAHIDAGAFIANGTHHRVLAAPYHRMPDAIMTSHQIFESRNDSEARALLDRNNIDYVVTCDGLDAPFADKPKRIGTLRARLIGGDVPTFLTRAPLANPNSIYKVWKVERTKVNPRP
ncbi:MAG: hypothetical protein ACT4OU_09715 [Hyphomicrobium sp.]